MLRSIATVSISGTLPEKLSAIAAAGYQGVEIFENDLLYYTGTPADVRFAILKAAPVRSLPPTLSGLSVNLR